LISAFNPRTSNMQPLKSPFTPSPRPLNAQFSPILCKILTNYLSTCLPPNTLASLTVPVSA